MAGFIKLHRTIQEHKIWTRKPFSYGHAWVDLLLLAAWKDHQFNGRDYKRGTVSVSQDWMAKRWGWQRKRVRTFIALLERDQMVTVCGSKGARLGAKLIINNYDTYQSLGPGEGPGKGQVGAKSGPYHKKVRRKDVDLERPPKRGALSQPAKRPMSHSELDNVQIKLPSNLATATFKDTWKRYTLWRTTLGERLQPEEAQELLKHYGFIGEGQAIVEMKAAMGNGDATRDAF